MLYLVPSSKPINYNSNYLLGSDLIDKIDSILNSCVSDSQGYIYVDKSDNNEDVLYSSVNL